MTDCNDSEGAVTVYFASGPCLIGACRILLIKTVMAPEISVLLHHMSYFITKKGTFMWC